MKKTLVALAALAVVSAASAQSTVTLYGVVDMGVAQLKDSLGGALGGATYVKNGVQQGTMSNSRIGFKGTEDLGGGLKANFVAELGFAPDETNGYQLLANRLSTVGLSGNFGAVTIGRQYTPYFVVQNAVDLLGNLNATPGYVVNAHMADGGRVSNSVQYASPSFGGFSGIVQVGAGSGSVTAATTTAPASPATTASTSTEALNGSTTAGKNFGLAGIYAAGPLVAAVAYNDITNPNNLSGITTITGQNAFNVGSNLAKFTSTLAGFGAGDTALGVATSNEVKTWAAGASYDFRVVKASLAYSSLTDTLSGSADLTSKGWNASIAAPLGAVTLAANLGRANVETTGLDATVTGYQLMANYALSKRTTAYAVYGHDVVNEATLGDLITRTSTTVGIRHTF